MVYVVIMQNQKTGREEVHAPDVSTAERLAKEKFGEQIVRCERRIAHGEEVYQHFFCDKN